MHQHRYFTNINIIFGFFFARSTESGPGLLDNILNLKYRIDRLSNFHTIKVLRKAVFLLYAQIGCKIQHDFILLGKFIITLNIVHGFC